ncbi:cob(I)yrinic acid a,c-diamide adenosyltransferase [Candidatus Omnitrophota bacterium]
MKKEISCGKIQVYTGTGKGKTTAALGLAFRALGQNKNVLLIQFLKQGNHLGELKAARRFKRFKIVQTGRKKDPNSCRVNAKDKQLAQKGLARAQTAIKSGTYDLIILDELNPAVYFKLIKPEQVLAMLKHKPAATELVITGRYADRQLVEIADLVSEIKEIKHYYNSGLIARPGIEY